MGKKKKAGKKKGGGGGGGASGPVSDYKPISVPADPENFVTLKFKLINWTYQNFDWRLRTTAPLFSIKKRLREKHGLMTDLHLYKEQVNPSNELVGDDATLEELGFLGAPLDAEEPACFAVFYDFKPCDLADPLLLVTPRTERKDEVLP